MHNNRCDKFRVLPERRRIGTTRRSVSGIYPFRGKPVTFESTLERDLLIRLDYSPGVLAVESQPVTIEYVRPDGRRGRYTPDYLVAYRGQPAEHRPWELVEVKPRAEIRRHFGKWRPKFRAAKRYCREMGYVFHIFDEARIRDQRWENAKFLQRYRRMRFEEADSQRIVDNLRIIGSVTFDGLLERHFIGRDAQAAGINHLWHLVATGRIACDLSQPLSRFIDLWVPDDE